MNNKIKFKEEIKNNIRLYDFHIIIVQASEHPRYAYSIGLIDKIGFEFIFSGGVYYFANEVISIFNQILWN